MASPLIMSSLLLKLAKSDLRDATMTTTYEFFCRASEQMGKEHGKRKQAVSDKTL